MDVDSENVQEAKKKKQECMCTLHETWKHYTTDNSVLNIIRSKVNEDVISFLRNHNFLGNYTNFLCKSCIAKAKFILTDEPQLNNSLRHAIDSLISFLKMEEDPNSVEPNVWMECFQVMGEIVLYPRILRFGESLSQKYRNIKYLKTMKPQQDVTSYDCYLLAMLEGLSKRTMMKTTDNKLTYHVIMVLESIFSLCNRNWIFPYHFTSNLVQSFISGSKIVTVLNGKITPGGGYSTYLNWLKDVGADKIECPGGDIVTFIDNIGKYVMKNYRVSKDKIASADVITTTLHIILKTIQSLQTNPNLKPILWGAKLTLLEKQTLMKSYIENARVIFRRCRINYLTQMIEIYKNQGGDVSSRIKELMSVKTRICVNEECKEEYGPRKRKCNLCDSEVMRKTEEQKATEKQTTTDGEKYINLGETKSVNQCDQIVGEPILLNPNSYENLEKIMDDLKENLIENQERCWTFVGCDGPPYCLASRIIERNPEKYDWLAMQPGLGHLNMNQMKGFFKILDKVCLRPLGQDVLNFNSPNAYKFFIGCKDTHKAWESFEIFLHGTVLELIHLYVDNENNYPTPSELSDWLFERSSATLDLMFEIVLTYGLGIYVQRVGDRNNDANVSDAGRFVFGDWFYGFNHPLYREIEYRDLLMKSILPEEVKQQLCKNLTFSTRNEASKNQGGDFMLEQKVQRQKLIAPKGPVGKTTWQRISRSVDTLDEIYSNTSKSLKMTSDTYPKIILLSEEIKEWRAVLRKSEFLLNDDPVIARNFYGDALSDEFANLSTNLREKRNAYWTAHLDGTALEKIKYDNIQIFPSGSIPVEFGPQINEEEELVFE